MLEQLIADLKEYEVSEIVFKSKVSFSTLNGILNGTNDNPTLKTVTALQKFLEEKKGE